MYYEFYIDVFFVVNLLLDFLVLCLTRLMLGETANPLKALAGAATGALGMCLFVLLTEKFYAAGNAFFYGISAVLMVRIGCGLKTPKKLILGTGTFYGASFLLGGVLLALPDIAGKRILIFTIITVTAYWIMNIGIRLCKYLKGKEAVKCRVIMAVNGRTMKVKGLYDTGNCLVDSETKKPVCVMEYRSFKELLDAEQKEALDRFISMEEVETDEERASVLMSLNPRFLLYTSVGCSRGMLPVVTADSLTVLSGDKKRQVKKAAIGLSKTALFFARELSDDYQSDNLGQLRRSFIDMDICMKTGGTFTGFKGFLLPRGNEIHYIGGAEVLPAPLGPEEESVKLMELQGEDSEQAKACLIEHNLRLVVYIAKKFDNTGVGVEDLISIGTIGLIKAINTFNPVKKIKLATYASRCIENEILMYLRRNSKTKMEVSIDEPLNVDWDGNELLLSDILGTDEDVIYKDIESEVERKLLGKAIGKLSKREQTIVRLRFGINMPDGREKTQKEVADLLGISQSYISRLEKRIMKRLKKEIVRYE